MEINSGSTLQRHRPRRQGERLTLGREPCTLRELEAQRQLDLLRKRVAQLEIAILSLSVPPEGLPT